MSITPESMQFWGGVEYQKFKDLQGGSVNTQAMDNAYGTHMRDINHGINDLFPSGSDVFPGSANVFPEAPLGPILWPGLEAFTHTDARPSRTQDSSSHAPDIAEPFAGTSTSQSQYPGVPPTRATDTAPTSTDTPPTSTEWISLSAGHTKKILTLLAKLYPQHEGTSRFSFQDIELNNGKQVSLYQSL